MTPANYKVFVSRLGNVYMTELASMLVEAIAQTGRPASLCTDGLPQSEAGVVNLVVAPHEFFVLQDGAAEADLVRSASQCITVGVEQPGTVWFEEGARYASYGPMALDINQRGVRELRRRGVEAHQLQLGYHPGWDVWERREQHRDNDVLFLGALTHRRAEFLARSARVLSDWECDLRVFEVADPVRAGSQHFVTGPSKHRLLADSRILLNVHQADRDYFEWVRVIEAISNGCLVITETSTGYEPLVPSQHFVQADLQSLAGRVDAFLRDEDLRTEAADRAYGFLRDHLAMADIVDRTLLPLERRLHPPVSSALAAGTRLPEALRRQGRPKPFASCTPPPVDHERLTAQLNRAGRMIASIKAVLSTETETGRAIEALISTIEFGSPVTVDIVETSSYAAADPEVSVVIPIANCGRTVRHAIASVAASERVRLELVIVDDHSADDSLAVARDALASLDDIPMRVVAPSAARGVAAARNLGFEHARAEFVFLSDVNGEVFPLGIHRLLRALRSSDAAFAYGIIEQPAPDPHLDSCLPWDVGRLTASNFIDTLSLIRTSTWKQLGGFDERAELTGDQSVYDFWLDLAANGQRGQLVSNFIGRHRSHDEALRSALAFEPTGRPEFLASKYPRLPWEAQEVSR